MRTTMAPIERKVEYWPIRTQMKTVGDESQGILEGLLNRTSVIDLGSDRTMPGCFKKSIKSAYARRAQSGSPYLWPYLFSHQADSIPIGGVFSAEENKDGLFIKSQLNMELALARDVFSSARAKTLTGQSMGYRAVTVEWVKEEGKSIRNILECEIMEASVTLFPMNIDSQITAVKRFWPGFSTKTACGDTSLPIGPRDASWDGASAHRQIVSWAVDGDGNVDASKMKKVHLQCDGDPEKITSYGYPFCNIVSGKPQINVGGVKACAGALSGARGASPGSDGPGMRRKVATLYARINKKYPDDPPLVPPWEKGNAMSIYTKDFTSNYQDEQLSDWQYDDFGDVVSALRASVQECFTAGRDPLQALEDDVLPQLANALRAYVQQGIDLGFSAGPASAAGVYPMMSMSGAGGESKAGYLNAATHAAAITSLDNIMRHAKVAKRALVSVSSSRRFNDLAGTPIYSSASSSDFFEQKEDEEDDAAILRTLTTELSVSNTLREAKSDLTSPEMTVSPVDAVDRALARLIESKTRSEQR
jgi:HK97 family phage prohead protease